MKKIAIVMFVCLLAVSFTVVAYAYQSGDVTGHFDMTNERYTVKDDKTDNQNSIPVYLVNGEKYFCVEDLAFCGYSHEWDAKNKVTHINYNGKIFEGVSEQAKKEGDIYYSDIKVYIDGAEIYVHNIGGYSLARIEDVFGIPDESEMTFSDEIPDWAPSHVDNPEDKPSKNLKSGDNVNVAIPDFAVTINGTAMEKDKCKYPVFVYEGITYFPMTYHNARFLGVETLWDDATQTLSIKKTSEDATYNAYSGVQNNKYNVATMPSYNIMVGDVKIDNHLEKYPILMFRDITYFPLTWEYAYVEFGWEYSFDHKNGLVIFSK